MILHADTIWLRLKTGAEVRALVRADAIRRRTRCLLLHGNPGSLLDWERVASQLSDVADIAAIDMPGFGESSRPGTEAECLSLDRLADHAIAAADALSWHEPFFIVGHSHGGGVAQAAAVRHPRRVAGLVLIATLGAPAHGSYRMLSLPGAAAVASLAGRLFRSRSLGPLNHGLLFAVMKAIFHPEPVPPDRVERELALFARRPELLLSMVHVARGRPCEQLLSLASDIQCPVLFLHGQDDALVPAGCAKSIHDRIVMAGGCSRFQLLPGAGHMLIDYQATDVKNSIAQFLSP